MVRLCSGHICGMGQPGTANSNVSEAITTADYPTPARRPANSQLDCSKAARVFGIRLPHWRQALESCLDELIASEMSTQSC